MGCPVQWNAKNWDTFVIFLQVHFTHAPHKVTALCILYNYRLAPTNDKYVVLLAIPTELCPRKWIPLISDRLLVSFRVHEYKKNWFTHSVSEVDEPYDSCRFYCSSHASRSWTTRFKSLFISYCSASAKFLYLNQEYLIRLVQQAWESCFKIVTGLI